MEIWNGEDEGISKARASIRTYAGYSGAWCIRAASDGTLREEQSQLEAFSRLGPSSTFDLNASRQHWRRGNLTWKAIQNIDVFSEPESAKICALWLPIQAYYAVHAFGLAYLSAKNGANNLPKSHGSFINSAAVSIVHPLFPAPFSAQLKQGYDGFNYLNPTLTNLAHDGIGIESGGNLRRPDASTRNAHIVQCLNTTRSRVVGQHLNWARTRAKKKGRSRGVLKGQRQAEIAREVGPTTVIDYLYRLRRKSNYEDPAMYHEGYDEADALLEFVSNTQRLATILCALLATLLWQVIDDSARDVLMGDVDMDQLLQILDRQYTIFP